MTLPLSEVVLLSLGVVVLVDLGKLALPVPLPGPAKLVAALAISAALALGFAADLGDWVVLWLGIAGLASLLHSLQKLLTAIGDEKRLTVLLNTTPGRHRSRI